MTSAVPPNSQEHAADGAASQDELRMAAPVSSDQGHTEDSALSLLGKTDLAVETIETLAHTASLLKYRRVKLALVTHPRTPRHISLPLLRQMYTFDLMQVALTAVVAGDLKRAAEDSLCARLESVPAGERTSLARKASGRVAATLLLDKDARVMQAALQNGRLTEAHVIQALMRPNSSISLVEAICHHRDWSVRREVRAALLRHEKTPMARAMEFARSFAPPQLQEILRTSKLPENIKGYLLRELAQRGKGTGAGR